MTITVAVIAPGNMGAAVGQRLVENGVTVITSLAGRSAATVARAREAGMTGVADEALGNADFILSILPPGDAPALAARLAPILARAAKKPVYVDCNAVCPETAVEIGAAITPTGAAFVDAGIIGGPPSPGGAGPVFYASGDAARQFLTLAEYGLDVRALEGGIGVASALKMSYGGLTKGLTAIGSAMVLGATKAGVADALWAELKASQPAVFAILTRAIPGMYSKAYRWVAEMDEVSAYVAAHDGARQMYHGMARFYEELAADYEGDQKAIDALTAFVKR
jgi:putative dehydrogenase